MSETPDYCDPEWVVSILKEMEGYVGDITHAESDSERDNVCDKLSDCIYKLQEYHGSY